MLQQRSNSITKNRVDIREEKNPFWRLFWFLKRKKLVFFFDGFKIKKFDQFFNFLFLILFLLQILYKFFEV